MGSVLSTTTRSNVPSSNGQRSIGDRSTSTRTPAFSAPRRALAAAVSSGAATQARPVRPTLALMAVYYWGLHRADLLPAPAIFLIGILQDILSGGPLGVNALIFLAVYGICVTQRRFFYGKSFFVVWWGFMMVALGVAVAEWLIACLLGGVLLAPEPALFECAMNISAYPLLGWLFVQVHRTLPLDE